MEMDGDKKKFEFLLAQRLVNSVDDRDEPTRRRLDRNDVHENDHNLPHLGEAIDGLVQIDHLHQRRDDESAEESLSFLARQQIDASSHCGIKLFERRRSFKFVKLTSVSLVLLELDSIDGEEF